MTPLTKQQSVYVVYFDDGTMLSDLGRYVREFPDARKFTSRRGAEQEARKKNKPYTIETVREGACAD